MLSKKNQICRDAGSCILFASQQSPDSPPVDAARLAGEVDAYFVYAQIVVGLLEGFGEDGGCRSNCSIVSPRKRSFSPLE